MWESLGENHHKGKLSAEEMQAQHHATDPFWQLLDHPQRNRAEIMQKIHRNPSVLKTRDPAGATPLLWLALLNSKEHIGIAREILEKDMEGHRICDKYEKETYEGENMLHIAIINKDIEFAQLLLEQNSDLLKHRATGTFFKTTCPYGEFPLSFAAASNQPDMIDLLIRHGAKLPAGDYEGLTPLHIAVRFDLYEIYDKLAMILKGQVDKGLFDGQLYRDIELSCLRFAAKAGSLEIFQKLLDRSKHTLWTYGPIDCFRYPVSMFERQEKQFLLFENNITEPFGGNLNSKNVMQLIIDHERLDIIQNCTVVCQFIDRKWQKCGSKKFYSRFIWFASFLVIFSVGIVLPPTSSRDPVQLQWWCRAACEIVVFTGAIGKSFIEMRELVENGWRAHFWKCSGAIQLENWSSALTCVGILLASATRLGKQDADGHVEECFLVLAALAGWSYFFFFLLGWHLTGPFVLMLTKIVRQDVTVLGVIFLVILGGFASAQIILGVESGFHEAAMHVWNCSTVAILGDSSVKYHEHDSELPAFKKMTGVVLAFGFPFLNGVILLNLLIAKMGDTYNHYVNTAETLWKLERARVLESMYREIDSAEKLELLKTCWFCTEDNKAEYYLVVTETKEDFYKQQSSEDSASEPETNMTSKQVQIPDKKETMTPAREGGSNGAGLFPLEDPAETDEKLRDFSPVLHSLLGSK